MYSASDDAALLRRVSPFGYLRFVDCVRLLAAFRRFLRPSSSLYAKTSAVRPCLFNLLTCFHVLSRELLTISFLHA